MCNDGRLYLEAFIVESTVCTRITVLGDVEWGIPFVFKGSLSQNVVADVRQVGLGHPESPSNKGGHPTRMDILVGTFVDPKYFLQECDTHDTLMNVSEVAKF